MAIVGGTRFVALGQTSRKTRLATGRGRLGGTFFEPEVP